MVIDVIPHLADAHLEQVSSGVRFQIRIEPGGVSVWSVDREGACHCEDRLAMYYDATHRTPCIVACGEDATMEALLAVGARPVQLDEARWLRERPRKPKEHDGEATIVTPIASGYVTGIVSLASLVMEKAFPNARRWWATAWPVFDFHRYDFELRDVTFEDEVRDELLRHIAASFAPKRCTIDGRPLRIPRRRFRFSDPVFLDDAWRVGIVLGFALLSYARLGPTLHGHAGIVLSALMLFLAVRQTMCGPR